MKSCLVMRDCLTYSSPPFLYFYEATPFPWAHGCVPFLLLFKRCNDISHSPSLAQHRRLAPSFAGAVFFTSGGLQSWGALARSQYMVLFPPQEMCWPKGEGGRWRSLGFKERSWRTAQKGGSCDGSRGQAEGRIYVLDEAARPHFCELLGSSWHVRLCLCAVGIHIKGCGWASRVSASK